MPKIIANKVMLDIKLNDLYISLEDKYCMFFIINCALYNISQVDGKNLD